MSTFIQCPSRGEELPGPYRSRLLEQVPRVRTMVEYVAIAREIFTLNEKRPCAMTDAEIRSALEVLVHEWFSLHPHATVKPFSGQEILELICRERHKWHDLVETADDFSDVADHVRSFLEKAAGCVHPLMPADDKAVQDATRSLCDWALFEFRGPLMASNLQRDLKQMGYPCVTLEETLDDFFSLQKEEIRERIRREGLAEAARQMAEREVYDLFGGFKPMTSLRRGYDATLSKLSNN